MIHTLTDPLQTPGLYLVPTPLGNPYDITLRALHILKHTDRVYCEDTRKTDALLAFHGIKQSLFCYNDHSKESERERILSFLQSGKNAALVSDAGTPLISDPGYKLVTLLQEQYLPVISLPGACAAITALTLSGFPTNRFQFEGFLSPKTQERKKQLARIATCDATVIIYEVARRIPVFITECLEAFGGSRSIAVLRELTKTYEEIQKGTATELAAYYQQTGAPKGEVVVVIHPAESRTKWSDTDIEAMLKEALQHGLSTKDAATSIAEETGIGKKEAYERALKLKG